MVDVRSLLGSLASTRFVTDAVDMGEVILGDQDYLFLEPVLFEVTLTNTGGGIVADGTARAQVRTQCVRCLCDFSVEIVAPVEGFYVMPGREEEVPPEQEFGLIVDGVRVDLEPAIRQAAILELPFAPLHEPECLGICPICGADRNVDPCACPPQTVPTPFSALEGLVQPEQEG
jgi:uncharacterized protein